MTKGLTMAMAGLKVPIWWPAASTCSSPVISTARPSRAQVPRPGPTTDRPSDPRAGRSARSADRLDHLGQFLERGDGRQGALRGPLEFGIRLEEGEERGDERV